MAIFSSRTPTAIDEREDALNDEIARLEKEISELKAKPAKALRARPEASVQTARISGSSAPGAKGAPPMVTTVVPVMPLEQAVPPLPLPPSPPPSLHSNPPPAAKPKAAATPLSIAVMNDPRFNELGERKFDVGQWWEGLKIYFRRETDGPANPDMVKYLATGSVQGLRPLRYERRIARNRTIGLVAILMVVLYGLAWVFFQR